MLCPQLLVLVQIICLGPLLARNAAAQNAEISTQNEALHFTGSSAIFETRDLSSPTSVRMLIDMISNLTDRMQSLEEFRHNVITTSQCPSGFVIASIAPDGMVTCNKSSAIEPDTYCPLGAGVRGINPDFSLACGEQPGSQDFDLRFKHSDASSYVGMDNALPDALTDFSIVFWYNSDKTGQNWLLSYYATGDNDLLIRLNPLSIWITGAQYAMGNVATPADGVWHHVAISVSRTTSTLAAYVDNTQVYLSTAITTLGTVPAGGLLAVGQDQDGGKGTGFDPSQAYDGMLSQLQIYSRYLTAQDVAKSYCGAVISGVQPVIRWNQLLDRVVGPGDIFYTQPSGVPSHACSGSPSAAQCGSNEAVVAVAANGAVTCSRVFPDNLNSTVAELSDAMLITQAFQTAMQGKSCSGNEFAQGVSATGEIQCSGPDLSAATCDAGEVLQGLSGGFSGDCVAAASVSELAAARAFQTTMQGKNCSGNAFVQGVSATGEILCSGPDLSDATCDAGEVLSGLTGNFQSSCIPAVLSSDYDLNFDHLTQEAYIRPSVVMPTLTEFTFSFWVKADYKPDNFILSYGAGSNTNAILLYSHSLSGYVNGASGVRTITSSNVLLDGTWHHCVYTWSAVSGKLTAYVDGAIYGSASTPGATGIPGGGSLVIGQEQDGSVGAITLDVNQRFQGNVSQLVFLTKEANAYDVASLYCGETPGLLADSVLFDWPSLRYDIVGSLDDITPMSPSMAPRNPGTLQCLTAVIPASGYALDFQHNSISHYAYPKIVIPEMTAMTLSFWISASNSRSQFLVSYAVDGVSGGDNVILLYFTTDANINIYINGRLKSFTAASFSIPTYLDGTWHHLMFAWSTSDASMDLFIDGQLVGNVQGPTTPTSTIEGSWSTPMKGGGSFLLGQEQDKPLYVTEAAGDPPRLDASQIFNGQITGMNMWSRRLNAADAKSVYSMDCRGSVEEGDVLKWSIFQDYVVGTDVSIVRPVVDPRTTVKSCPA
jgi:hypothetical protein